MSESFAELFEQSMASTVMRPSALTVAEVVSIEGDYVTLSAGLKSEAEVLASEFFNAEGTLDINVGDKVEVTVESVDDGYGQTRLSREKARRERAWEDMETADREGQIVHGVLTGKVKGGFTVSIEGVRAFLPGSLVDVRPVKDSTFLEGKDLEFKIIKLDRARNNVVVSRRAVVEKEMSVERDALLASLQEGQVIRGIVKNLTDYGAFVNLGGIDGLLHITDMSWRRIKHPSEVMNVGDEIDVRVLKFDRERNRVSLGYKQLGEDPWQNVDRRYPETTRLFGKVTNITDYGVFVELEEGVEGLVHVSEIDWTNKNIHPSKVCKPGDEVEVMVLDVDVERRRISLGMKQCSANPWDEFGLTHSKGDYVTGNIKSITDFGIFVGLDGGIDGLIYLTDLSWDDDGEDHVKDFSKGQEVTAMVLAVDPGRERISLGIKQTITDPFSSFVSNNGKGSVVKGKVTEVDAKGAVVNLAESVDGYLRASGLSRDRVEDARTVLSIGDEVEAKIVSIDRKTRNISLSVKAYEDEQEDQAIREYTVKTASKGSTFADKLTEKLGRRDES